MPYLNGKRVPLDEYLAANGSTFEKMRTGPRGENPGQPVAVDPETGAPEPEPKAKGKRRSGRSEKAAKSAVANALGVDADSPALADIDLSGTQVEEDQS